MGLDLDWDRIDALPVEKSRKIWADHGRGHLADHAMLEAKSLFSSFGADAFVSDAIAWGGEDFELDLNLTLGWWRSRRIGRFDIIVDPGTLEHCFNIARAFINLDMLLRPGGFIYHQDAIAFPNHGLWSISPTTFFDFYEPRGYELGSAVPL